MSTSAPGARCGCARFFGAPAVALARRAERARFPARPANRPMRSTRALFIATAVTKMNNQAVCSTWMSTSHRTSRAPSLRPDDEPALALAEAVIVHVLPRVAERAGVEHRLAGSLLVELGYIVGLSHTPAAAVDALAVATERMRDALAAAATAARRCRPRTCPRRPWADATRARHAPVRSGRWSARTARTSWAAGRGDGCGRPRDSRWTASPAAG